MATSALPTKDAPWLASMEAAPAQEEEISLEDLNGGE